VTHVWVVTLNGFVEAVCANQVLARQAIEDVKERVSQHGRAGRWHVVGDADEATALAWSAQSVTSLRAVPWTVES
jgi:hypothetical protein